MRRVVVFVVVKDANAMQAREKVRDKVLDAKLNFQRKEGWKWNERAMKALVTSK